MARRLLTMRIAKLAKKNVLHNTPANFSSKKVAPQLLFAPAGAGKKQNFSKKFLWCREKCVTLQAIAIEVRLTSAATLNP